MGHSEIKALQIHLATEQHVAASTQNYARSAILFLYRYVLDLPVEVPVSVLTTAYSPTRQPYWSRCPCERCGQRQDRSIHRRSAPLVALLTVGQGLLKVAAGDVIVMRWRITR